MLKISDLTFLITIVPCVSFFSIKLHLRLGETEHNHIYDLNQLKLCLQQPLNSSIAKQEKKKNQFWTATAPYELHVGSR